MLMRPIITFILCLTLVSCGSSPKQAPQNKGINFNVSQVTKSNPVMRAAETGNVSLLQGALRAGRSVNSYNLELGSAFSVALRAGHTQICVYLMNLGADLQLGYSEGQKDPLMEAAERGMNPLVKSLILRGFDTNASTPEGYTPAYLSAVNGHLTTLKILLNAGASANAVIEGQSLLMHVVEDDNMLISQVLIKAGADVNYRGQNGDTALKIARKKGLFDLDLMLVQAGADS